MNFKANLSLINRYAVVCYSNLIFFDDKVYALEKTLSSKEKLRSKRFRRKRDTNNYIIRHAILRQLLSEYLECDPIDIDIQADKYGKPYLLSDNCNEFSFNMSSSGNFAVFSFFKSGTIGIDIEKIRPLLDMQGIVQRFFTIQENQKYKSFSGKEQLQFFFKLWTRKEAVLKSQGMGLLKSLKDFDVNSISPFTQPIKLIVSENGGKETYWVSDIDEIIGYAIAIAVSKPIDGVLLFEKQ